MGGTVRGNGQYGRLEARLPRLAESLSYDFRLPGQCGQEPGS